MKIAPLEDRHRRLIEIVARAFATIGRWPLFPHVEAALDHEHGLVFDEVIADLPAGLVWSPSGYGPQAEVRASVAALSAIGARAEDLDRYVKLVRRAAAIEAEYTPGPLEQSDLRIGRDDVLETAALIEDDAAALQRLLTILEAEHLLVFSGSRDGEWWLTVDSRVRPYRDLANVDDYVARRPLPALPSSWVPGPTLSAPTIFVVMPLRPDWAGNVYDMIGQACREVAVTIQGLTWERADEIAQPGRITDQIVNAIDTANLIVADLTDNNPNVMFELGYADRARKEVVLLNQEIDTTPFDIKDWRQIRYNVQDLAAARAELVTFVRGALSRQGYR